MFHSISGERPWKFGSETQCPPPPPGLGGAATLRRNGASNVAKMPTPVMNDRMHPMVKLRPAAFGLIPMT
jgi:hypothetical protein